MKKYLLVMRNTWSEVFTYRFNFVMWRFRGVIQLLTVFYLWSAIMPAQGTLFGYSQGKMLTYILGASLLSSLVLASRSYDVGEDINKGNLSNYLIRPINYFFYWFSKDVGDKAMNVVFSIAELTLLFVFLKPPLFFQNDLPYLLLSVVASLTALFLYFLFNFLIGLIGFWSSEVWGPRFIFMMLLNILAGSLFPLDILPPAIYNVVQLLPFSYLLFFPMKIYLGQLSFQTIYMGIFVSFVWMAVLYGIVSVVWQRGLRLYTAQGR